MNKTLTVPGIAAVVALIIGFGAGYFVPHGAQAKGAQFAQFAGRTGGGMGAGAARGFGGAVAGQIISADSGSITVKMQDGSTKIVLMGSSTPILKTINGSTSDLSVGTNVVVAGTANSDGSVTAQSVQIRPAGMNGASNAPMIRYNGQ